MLSRVIMTLCVWLASPLSGLVLAAPPPRVETARVPDGGVQPQVAVDSRGVVHMIYLTGKPNESDIAYVRSADGGKNFSPVVVVNSQPGSAIATGTIRGPHLTLGKNGRPHVAWMGSARSKSLGTGGATPMLYARGNQAGDAFEPQRDLIQRHPGLDGGGSIAADAAGHVFVAWHAPQKAGGDEADRRLWVAKSTDDGVTFAPEEPASSDKLGACGCCGMRAFTPGDGKLWLLYRTATAVVNRDMALVEFDAAKHTFREVARDPMKASTCIMSTAALAQRDHDVIAAWETDGQIHWQTIGTASATDKNGVDNENIAGENVADDTISAENIAAENIASPPNAVPGAGGNRKHPAIAVNADSAFIIAWTEGTAWNQGGSVAWQVFDRTGKAIAKTRGHADGLPAWGLPAAFARKDGSFVVVY